MRVYEEKIRIPADKNATNPLEHLIINLDQKLSECDEVVRLAITKSTNVDWEVEIGAVTDVDEIFASSWRSVLDYRQRGPENYSKFNVALIIPTGIGAELGGHAGDAGVVARLLGSAADSVITHPNVVNASDINEMPENCLYVEGSILGRLLMGQVGLQPTRSNRLLGILDDHTDKQMVDHAINSIGAARASMGLECPMAIRLQEPLVMSSWYSDSGRAVGEINGIDHLINITEQYEDQFDVIAITSRVQVPKSYHYEYYLGGLVNPWGGVEAMLTHTVSTLTGKQSAHAPMMESEEILNLNLGVVDPRMAAEVVSVTYLNCVLKGLQRSPRVVWDAKYVGHPGTMWAEDVSAIVVPKGCVGLPTLAALIQGIPVIEVLGNQNLMDNDLSTLPFKEGQLIQVDSYIEAAGVIALLKSGVSLGSVKRPLTRTKVIPDLTEEEAGELGNVVRLVSK